MITWLEKNKYLAGIITLILAIEIFLFSNIPIIIQSETKLNLSIIYHFGIFFMFSFFLLMSIKGNNKINQKEVFLVLAISILYAISDEIHQIFVIGRIASLKDILIDSIGSLCSMIIYFFADWKTKSLS